MGKKPYIWLQEDEDQATASCGCCLVRDHAGSGSPAIFLCDIHSHLAQQGLSRRQSPLKRVNKLNK